MSHDVDYVYELAESHKALNEAGRKIEILTKQNEDLYTANEQLCYENKKLEDTLKEIRMLVNTVVS